MSMSRKLLNFFNELVTIAVALVLLLMGAYSGYALWDNERIYASAENVQADMIRLKPEVVVEETEEGWTGPSFEQLLAINPDVCGWVSMANTKIDYPVLQGETNFSYINTDVYGNFALPGSIFLDSRSDGSFGGGYWLLYGHHMENGGMFGDLELYKDKEFFENNTTGMLILPGVAYELDTIACLVLPADDKVIFEPVQWEANIEGLLEYAMEHSMYKYDDKINSLLERNAEARKNGGEIPKVIALTTCTNEFTDARTIVLAELKEYSVKKQEVEA